MVTCTRTTRCVSTDNLQLSRIERMLCEKVTIFHYIVNNFTNCTSLTNEQFYSDVIYDVKCALCIMVCINKLIQILRC